MTYSYVSHTAKIYIDGILNSTSTNIPSPNSSTTSQLYIGNDILSYSYDGSIDEIRIYHRVLSDDEIKSLATN